MPICQGSSAFALRWLPWGLWACAVGAVACGSDSASLDGALPADAAVAAAVDAADSSAVPDAAVAGDSTAETALALDSAGNADADSAGSDGGAGSDTGGPTQKATGTLRILHLNVPAGLTLAMGQATLVVGPSGDLVLIDIANGSHDDDIRKVVEQLNTQELTPAKGYPARQPRQVEWVLLTHFHGDHVGGFGDLLLGKNALQVTRGIVHRGPVDLGPAANEGDWEVMCQALAGPLAKLHKPLCHGQGSAPCNSKDWKGNYAATDCPGLLRGDLASASDDALGQPAFIDLGGGARLTLTIADAFVSDGKTLQATAPFGYADTNEENGRCLGGVIAHGAFRYHFGGDLTGSGKAGEPDVESLLASRALPAFLGPLGADVSHVHHHARHTSSNANLIKALAPADGLTRNAVASINAGYLGSPHEDTVAAWTANQRLGKGSLWCTDKAAGGAAPKDFAGLKVLGATVAVETLDGGEKYRVGPWQGAGGVEFGCLR